MNKILIVDDDEDILLSLSLILKRNGFEVVTLQDCRKTVQTITHENPELVLLDINLGFCDGRELCLKLKNTQHYPHHVILFSANPELVKSIDLYKADEFIKKPFSIKEFVETMRQHMPLP